MTKTKSLPSLPGKNPPLLPENYYHLYNRGVNRQPIFFNKDNWRFFIQKMRQYFLPDLLTILAYVTRYTNCQTKNHIAITCHSEVLRRIPTPSAVTQPDSQMVMFRTASSITFISTPYALVS